MISTIKRILGNLEDAAVRLRGIDAKLGELATVFRENAPAKPLHVAAAPVMPSSDERSVLPASLAAIDFAVNVAPLEDIPFARGIDPRGTADPSPAIATSSELDQAGTYFAQNASSSRSLVSAVSHAWLYTLIRLLKPVHVAEIGTYMAGTSQTICRALALNGAGTLHTTDPFGATRVPAILAQWPDVLRRHVQFYPLTSMDFFSEMLAKPDMRADLVFVDGNHDYEFAAYDIGCAARMTKPGGFIVVDNVSQAGPFFAARDFLALNPHWTECRVTDRLYDEGRAFEAGRSNIANTDFIVVRSPVGRMVGARPVSFGEAVLESTGFREIRCKLGSPVGDGTLRIQAILRGFSGRIDPRELVAEASRVVGPADAGQDLIVPLPLDAGAEYDVARLELWLTWTGSKLLPLREPPAAIPLLPTVGTRGPDGD